MNEFEIELKESNKKWEIKKKSHLSKFNNLDLFFKNIEKILKEYYNEKKENYNNFSDFVNFIKELVKNYIQFINYEGNIDGLDELEKKLGNFIETYDKIIYFGEFNPVEARKQRLKEKGELNVNVKKEKGYFINILSKILEDIKKESEI